MALLSLVGRPLRRGLLHPAVHAEGVCLVSLEGGSEQLVVPPGLAATAVVTATQRQSPPQPRCRGLAALPADFLQSTLTGAPVLFKEEIQALWMRVAAALPSCLLGPYTQPSTAASPSSLCRRVTLLQARTSRPSPERCIPATHGWRGREGQASELWRCSWPPPRTQRQQNAGTH